MKHKSTLVIFFIFLATYLNAQYRMEYLTRGVHALRQPDGKVFISWRLLGTESNDISFNLYRANGDRKEGSDKTIRLNSKPITKSTNFIDETAAPQVTYSYYVSTIVKGREHAETDRFVLKPGSNPYVSIPLRTPEGYSANDASVGDMDGDGVYEVVIHLTGRAKDNSQAGITDPPVFHCYKVDGTFLWEINLGKNIREGAHYTQFMVYDFDSDGKAEIAMKTADGSVDGKGIVIGDSTKDYRNDRGYILSGPEYLTMFDGLTGEALSTVDFIPPRHDKLNPTTDELNKIWGDGYGNRMDRFLACVAYLDGNSPSLIMCRGYYTRSVLTAFNFRNKKLQKLWTFDSDDPSGANRKYRGQGNHNLSVADVDNDGKDEIVYGAMTIDDNGTGLYSTGLGHGDALHVTDIDPSRPGLEIFDIQERFDDAGAHLNDAKTGEVIWKKASIKAGADGEGPGRGCALDLDPRYPGYECWVAGAGITGLFDCKGNKIAEKTPPCNMGILWDGDALSEVLNGVNISKWDYINSAMIKLFDGRDDSCASNNGTKANPCLSADLYGDWREEIICRTSDNRELRIYSTTIPTDIKLYTLMHNPQYRLSIAWQNVAYNQPPHTSYHLGDGMKMPPKPNIVIVKKK
jgi:rhamnogalacturonan endolyase